MIRLEIVLSTLVSPTRRTESNPVVIAFYEKKQVVSSTHLKKNDYYGVRNTPLSEKLKAWQALATVHGEPESDRVA